MFNWGFFFPPTPCQNPLCILFFKYRPFGMFLKDVMKEKTKGEASREQILEAALKLFIKKGYRGTSLEELCKATGFTKGGLYHHFNGKEDLYHQALKEFFNPGGLPDWICGDAENLESRIRSGFLDIDLSKKWIQARVGTKDDNGILQFYTFLYEATRRYPEFQNNIDTHDEAKHKALEEHFQKAQEKGEIRSDLNPRLLALELDALLQQLIYLRFVNPHIKTEKQLPLNLFENYWKRLV